MIAFFDCFSGISGDMALGALVDAGLPLERLQAQLDQLAISGYTIRATKQVDAGIAGTRLEVVLDSRPQPPRRLSDVVGLLEASDLDREIVRRSSAVFARLARAEGAVHGKSPDDVHFHEVGAVDAIVDIVGTVVGLQELGVEAVFTSSLPLATGTIRAQHGTLPLPAPGTLALLAEARAPTRPIDANAELVTPTGAALLCELARFEQPALQLQRVGYGFGRRRLPWPNCLRLWLGDAPAERVAREEVVLLEANVDDMSGEGLGYAMERLFAAGALDVFFEPIQMKKNRPGVLVGVLARPPQQHDLAGLLLAETSTLGVRVARLERYVAERQSQSVETAFGPLRVKIKRAGGRTFVSPEYEDAAAVARERGVPLSAVYQAALAAQSPAE